MRKFLSRALIATALAALPSVALAQSFPTGQQSPAAAQLYPLITTLSATPSYTASMSGVVSESGSIAATEAADIAAFSGTVFSAANSNEPAWWLNMVRRVR